MIKLTRKQLFISSFLLALIVMGVFAFPLQVAADAEFTDESEIMPKFGVYVDGTFTPDLFMLNKLIPQDQLRTSSRSESYLQNLPIGASWVPDNPEEGIYRVDKVGTNNFIAHFYTYVDAPLLNIWTTPIDNAAGSVSLDASETDVGAIPDDQAQSSVDMGLSYFYGGLTDLHENTTEDETGTTWEFTTDFDLSTYNILILDGVQSYGTNNVSITVSYVETTTYTNLNSTYADNDTIFNEYVADQEDYWFRLDLEHTNTSFDEYVADISISGAKFFDSRMIASTDANTTDMRYETLYLGGRDSTDTVSALSKGHSPISSETIYQQKLEPTGTHTDSQITLDGIFSSITPAKLKALPTKLQIKASNVINEARGWKSVESFENSIKSAIVSNSRKVDSIGQVDALTLTNAIGNWEFPTKAKDYARNVLKDVSETAGNIGDALQQAQDKTVKSIQFAVDVGAKAIETGKEKAKDVAQNVKGGFAAFKEDVNQFGQSVKEKITDAADKISEAPAAITSWAKDVVAKAGGLLKKIGLPVLIGIGIAAILLVVIFVAPMFMGGPSIPMFCKNLGNIEYQDNLYQNLRKLIENKFN